MSEPNTITVMEDGPLHCKGELRIGGDAHSEAYLCRCGRSANTPFCDGSHQGHFEDEASLTVTDFDPDAFPVEPLEITPMQDGPLMFRGAFLLAEPEGHLVAGSSKAALCRCGASERKPYCDGAHRGCGFKAP